MLKRKQARREFLQNRWQMSCIFDQDCDTNKEEQVEKCLSNKVKVYFSV